MELKLGIGKWFGAQPWWLRFVGNQTHAFLGPTNQACGPAGSHILRWCGPSIPVNHRFLWIMRQVAALYRCGDWLEIFLCEMGKKVPFIRIGPAVNNWRSGHVSTAPSSITSHVLYVFIRPNENNPRLGFCSADGKLQAIVVYSFRLGRKLLLFSNMTRIDQMCWHGSRGGALPGDLGEAYFCYSV